jgi:mannose-1-phosphate guanylyltransferase
MFYKPVNESNVRNRCAIILAAGEGVRLRSFVESFRGDTLPKQYVKFFGDHSMLQSTFQRAQRLIPRERIFTVVDQSHFEFAEVTRQLVDQPKTHVVIQPSNRDTAIGLLLPLAHLLERHPDATVAVFPSDHFIADDDLFMAHVDAAFDIIEQDDAKIVLLGVSPQTPDTDYGYIVPADNPPSAFPCGAQIVSRFVEKPAADVAQEIVSLGGLWNTLVMVFRAQNFLSYVRAINNRLYSYFWRIRDALGAHSLMRAMERIYERAQPVNLSKGVLEELPRRCPSRLLVLPVRGVDWCDCGSEERMVKLLSNAAKPGAKPIVPQTLPLPHNAKLTRTA